jgi:hypothetical protein
LKIVFWLKLLIEAKNFGLFDTHIDIFQGKKFVYPIKRILLSLFCPKTYFRAGSHENKEKHLCYYGLGNLLPIQIQLLDIENPKHMHAWG